MGWLDFSMEDRIVGIVVRFTPTSLTAAKFDGTMQTHVDAALDRAIVTVFGDGRDAA